MEIKRKQVPIAGGPRTYSLGTTVTGAKGFVFLSGATARDVNTGKVPEGIGEQTKLVMENIKMALEEHGASLKNILHMRYYEKGEFPNGIRDDPKHQEMVKTRQDFWRENCPEFLRENNAPSGTAIGVTALADPNYLIEIDVVAAIE